MQIAGNKCKVCGRNIVFASEGKSCACCQTSVHLTCEPQANCDICGQPYQVHERPKVDPLSEVGGRMRLMWTFMHRTDYIAWCVAFFALLVPTSLCEVGPFDPLWLALMFWPFMLPQVFSDGQGLEELLLLGGILLALVSISWVLQCLYVLSRSRLPSGAHAH